MLSANTGTKTLYINVVDILMYHQTHHKDRHNLHCHRMTTGYNNVLCLTSDNGNSN